MNQNKIENMSSPDDYINESITSFDVSSNWEVIGNTKKFSNLISIGLIDDCLTRMTLEDIVDEKGSMEIKRKVNDSEPCTVEIKLKDRGKKIARVGIVSEASVLEIFRESGEYTTTIFADFIDEFEDATVYYAEVALDRPSSEVSIKFTRIKNNKSTMFLYGIRLLLQQSEASNTTKDFDATLIKECFKKLLDKANKEQGKLSSYTIDKKHENISNNYDLTVNNNTKNFLQNACEHFKLNSEFLTNVQYEKNEQMITVNRNSSIHHQNIETMLALKITEMEQRLSRKIDLLEMKTNERLDKIIKLLDLLKNSTVEQ